MRSDGKSMQLAKSLASGMKVIRHAGVDSRMIILDNQASQQMTHHFNVTFCPSQALSGIQYLLALPVLVPTVVSAANLLQPLKWWSGGG